MQLSPRVSFFHIRTSDYWQIMPNVYKYTKGCANKINEVEKIEFQINDQPPIVNAQHSISYLGISTDPKLSLRVIDPLLSCLIVTCTKRSIKLGYK